MNAVLQIESAPAGRNLRGACESGKLSVAKRSKKPAKGNVSETRDEELGRLIREQQRANFAESFGVSESAKSIAREQRFARGEREGRHDLKSPPKGHIYEKGHLVPDRQPGSLDPNNLEAGRERCHGVALKLITELSSMFYGPGPNGRSVRLIDAIGPWLRRTSPGGFISADVKALEAAHEALLGYPYGYEEWKLVLISQLETNAWHSEEKRLREEHGHSVDATTLQREMNAEVAGASYVPANGRQILEWVKHWNPPPKLTASRIDEMIAKVGLGAGGPQKKRTARAVVNEFAESPQKPPQRKSSKISKK